MEKGEISKQQFDAAKGEFRRQPQRAIADEQRFAQAQAQCRDRSRAARSREGKGRTGAGGRSSKPTPTNRVGMRSADAQAKLAKLDQVARRSGGRPTQSELLQHRQPRLTGSRHTNKLSPGRLSNPVRVYCRCSVT